jgi:uroporphyrinogen III methyltransferase / synthase
LPGKVYLVGAGPGDPGLITVKGRRCLEQAQVVVFDRLLDSSLLEAVPASAERVFVGKERGRQALTQDEINQLLIDCARAGKVVVRLKGGDPFVFGRGGEEALVLAGANISFEVVPGITSAIAAPAYAGIPLTHRKMASCFTVVSGSEDPAKPESAIPWGVLACTGGTLVVLMGWATLEGILETLQQEGMSPATPAALIQWGTWAKQRVVTGALDNILARGWEAGLKPPVIAIIGDVVTLRDELRWFDCCPLFGKRVLITRSRTQASRLRSLLQELGAEPVELPSIEIAPLEDYTQLDAALSQLNSLDWVIFASVNSVEAVFDRLKQQGKDARAFANAAVGAIGPATADALMQRGIKADFIPARSVSEAVIEELSGQDWQGVSVLLPGSDIGRDVLEQGLTRLGASVHRVAVYRTLTPQSAASQARQILEEGVDAVTFTSSSTVSNLLDILNGNKQQLESSLIACIGPITATTALELGLRVDVVADEHTVEGLVDALVEHFGKNIKSK